MLSDTNARPPIYYFNDRLLYSYSVVVKTKKYIYTYLVCLFLKSSSPIFNYPYLNPVHLCTEQNKIWVWPR